MTVHQARVEAMLAEQMPLDAIEDYIEDTPLPADAKSALWLLAWVETDRHDRRRVVKELLAGLVVRPEPC